MTPHEWLMEEYQRKAALFDITTWNDDNDNEAQYVLLLGTVDIQPFFEIKQDHCEPHPHMEDAFIWSHSGRFDL